MSKVNFRASKKKIKLIIIELFQPVDCEAKNLQILGQKHKKKENVPVPEVG